MLLVFFFFFFFCFCFCLFVCLFFFCCISMRFRTIRVDWETLFFLKIFLSAKRKRARVKRSRCEREYVAPDCDTSGSDLLVIFLFCVLFIWISPIRLFALLQASSEGLLVWFAPSGFAHTFLVASLKCTLCFVLAFLVAFLSRWRDWYRHTDTYTHRDRQIDRPSFISYILTS